MELLRNSHWVIIGGSVGNNKDLREKGMSYLYLPASQRIKVFVNFSLGQIIKMLYHISYNRL